VEGVMGLYDGLDPLGKIASTAQMAKLLRCPVVLVVDVSATSGSVAAAVRGFKEVDREVPLVGCIVNGVASPAHLRAVCEGLERWVGLPVLGHLPYDERFTIPQRHLGLVPAMEDSMLRQRLDSLLERIRKGIRWPQLMALMRRAKPLDLKDHSHRVSPHRLRSSDRLNRLFIAVAHDEAFHFYYPDNLDLLRSLGLEPVPFSPLRAKRLPKEASALYLGGGFPEIFASPLSENRPLHKAIRCAAKEGMPIYAECGGLIFLAKSLETQDGKRFPMVGLVPSEIRMTDRLQRFGYKWIRASRTHLLARKGEVAKGHEFHHSVAIGLPLSRSSAYEVRPANGLKRYRYREGYARGSVLASYIHLHFWGQPRWAVRLVRAAWGWRRGGFFKACKTKQYRNIEKGLATGNPCPAFLRWAGIRVLPRNCDRDETR